MFITINCLGLPFNGDTVKNKSLGGSESAAYYMALELQKLGHEVTVFSNTDKEGFFDGVRYINAGNQTQAAPLGEMFHFYAENTPHDVCIIQRHPHAFRYRWASKINLWWVHDLALLRMRDDAMQQMWNIDGIICVSEFHKKQYMEVYGINPDIIFPVENGVDPELFNLKRNKIGDKMELIYISRPERGLEHLVMPNGIMERLGDKYHLSVCAYDNTTPDTQAYYEYLWKRCELLPNVTNLGFLSKPELAQALVNADAMVYPTPGPAQPNFEEVSCIAAMEAMHAGIPMITSAAGALPETCKDSGTIMLLLVNGMPPIEGFVNAIRAMCSDRIGQAEACIDLQRKASEKYTWKNSALKLMDIVRLLIKKNRSEGAIDTHLIEMSDIYAYKSQTKAINNRISEFKWNEFKDCYRFINGGWAEHYAKYYEYEKARGVNYGPETLEGNSRFEHVSSIIGNLPDGSRVLDYGCAHGHYSVNLAKRFPKINFTGVDITQSNIDTARKWAEDDGVTNVSFMLGSQGDINSFGHGYSAIIAAEVIEHVGEPQALIDSLSGLLAECGRMIVTTPFGPWEAFGYKEHWPFRAHVHHFDRIDIIEAFGHHPGFKMVSAPSGRIFETAIGSYIYSFTKPKEKSRDINYDRKLANIVPRQTVSLCMILKESEESILACLRSVKNIVNEIIIGFDKTGKNDEALRIVESFCVENRIPGYLFDIESPTSIGFDEARNQVISKACGDWILWLDSDEELINGESLYKFLRNNQFDGYAIVQDHFANEPAGVLKEDLPVKLFRNGKGIKFFGVVHEHPEKAVNEGCGHVQLLPGVRIAHYGYGNENVRRQRFMRNIGLLMRDREKHPERWIGKFLWLRDLAQMSMYEMEENGNRVTREMRDRAIEGHKLWRELISGGQLRMAIDGMDYYSFLSDILGNSFDFGMAFDSGKMGQRVDLGKARKIVARFASREDVDMLTKAIVDAELIDYSSRYY